MSASVFMTLSLNSLSGNSLISILRRSVFRVLLCCFLRDTFLDFPGHSWFLRCVLCRLFRVWCAGHVQGLNIILSLVQVLGWLSNLAIVQSQHSLLLRVCQNLLVFRGEDLSQHLAVTWMQANWKSDPQAASSELQKSWELGICLFSMHWDVAVIARKELVDCFLVPGPTIWSPAGHQSQAIKKCVLWETLGPGTGKRKTVEMVPTGLVSEQYLNLSVCVLN